MKTFFLRFMTLAVTAAATVVIMQCSTSTIAINKAELKNVKTVAIMTFEPSPGVSKSVAKECEESFRGNFINAGFNVVERDKLNSIMKEAEFSQTGLTEKSIELGKMLGAEALLFGEVTKNFSEVRLVNYTEYIKNPVTRKMVGVEKVKNMKFFTFQIHIRLVSAITGNTILTIKNKYPERDFEMTSTTTLEKFRESILSQMGEDLKDAIEED